MADTITFTILDDGVIRIDTDTISGPNHVTADQLLRAIAEMAGGTVRVTPKVKTTQARQTVGNALKTRGR